MAATAAQRTFAIPELLERILIQLARQCPLARGLDPSTSRWLERFPVVKQLFVLRRVNSSFKNGLHSSKELRRWMEMKIVYNEHQWLHHGDDVVYEHHDNDVLIPLVWLFSYTGLQLGHPKSTTVAKDGATIREVVLQKHPRESPSLWPHGFDRSRHRTRMFARPESSWRNVKIFGEEDETAILHIEVRVHKKNKNAMPSYIQTWDFHREDNATLGDVYDGLKEVYGRTREQHAKISEQRQLLNGGRSWKGLYIQEASQ